MWIDRLIASRTTHALELSAQFAEQRHQLLAENLANVDTPDYATRHLDSAAFETSLQEALAQARSERERQLKLRDNRQFASGPDGRMQVRPEVRPAENVLFHDGTNVKLETLLSDVAENQMRYDLSTTLLRGRFQNLLRAIRGRVE